MQGYFIWMSPLRFSAARKDPAMDPHSLMGKSCVSQGILVIPYFEILNAVLNVVHPGRLFWDLFCRISKCAFTSGTYVPLKKGVE